MRNKRRPSQSNSSLNYFNRRGKKHPISLNRALKAIAWMCRCIDDEWCRKHIQQFESFQIYFFIFRKKIPQSVALPIQKHDACPAHKNGGAGNGMRILFQFLVAKKFGNAVVSKQYHRRHGGQGEKSKYRYKDYDAQG